MKSKIPLVASVSRRFQQSAERVFDAFLDPAKASRFLFATPDGQMVKAEIDAKVGGRFCFVERRAGKDVEHTGEYLEIVRPRRLVFSFTVTGYSAAADRVAIELEPTAEGGCTLTLRHELAPEAAPVKRRAQHGWANILDGAARVLGDGEPGRALAVVDGGFEWTFEQRLPVAPERAFRALTLAAELQQWFSFRIEGRFEPGAELRFSLPSGELPPQEGVVLAFEPPHVLAYTWGQQAFHLELSAGAGAGTVLLMTNSFPAAMKAQRDSEGSWQHCQDALRAQLGALAQYLEARQ